MSELERMIQVASAYAEEIFAAEGSIDPMWYLITKDGQNVFMPMPPFDKDTAADLVRVICELHGARSCVFFNEAWSVETGDWQEMRKLQRYLEEHETLENHPNRGEIITFAAEAADGETLIAQRAVLRTGSTAVLAPLVFNREVIQSDDCFIGMIKLPWPEAS